MSSRSKKRQLAMAAAFFDLDETLIKGSAAVALAQSLKSAGLTSRRSLARLAITHAIFKLSASHKHSMRLAQLGLKMSTGWSQKDAKEIVERNFESVIYPLIFKNALDTLQTKE